jgi:serine/threonine-protein kinase RsbW
MLVGMAPLLAGLGLVFDDPHLLAEALPAPARDHVVTIAMSEFKAAITAEPSAIADLTTDTMEFLQGAGVDGRATHHVALVLEELLTNIATHGGAPVEPTWVRITVEPQRVAGEVIDAGTPFDPRGAPAPDIHAPEDDRPIGGLGLFLVTELTSELEYAHRDGRNHTAFAVGRKPGDR